MCQHNVELHYVCTIFRISSLGSPDEPGTSGINRKRTSSSGGGVKLHLATDPTDTSEGAVHGYEGNLINGV